MNESTIEGPTDDRAWFADLAALLVQIPLFQGLSAEERSVIAAQCQFRHLAGGELLIEEGKSGTELYVVISGRLKASRRATSGEELILGEVGRGDLAGEMALMTDERRLASVYAIRDSVVAALSRQAFDELTIKFPGVLKHIARIMVQRLSQPRAAPQARQSFTLALVQAGTTPVDLSAFAATLEAALAKLGKTVVVSGERTPPDSSHWVAARLNALETEYRFVVYLTDPVDSAWTRLCLRQADRVLLVGAAPGSPAPGPLEAALKSSQPPVLAQRDLVLLHPASTTLPSRTQLWREPRPEIGRHFHVREGHAGDLERLARILAQRPLGLVLGGGGARGFAHIGVYRALSEAGLVVDMFGGTSIGAVMGALFAMGLDWQEVQARCKVLERQKVDYTLPLLSMAGGFGLASAARDFFSGLNLEDLWHPFFCVATNLTRAEISVHRSGPAMKWVRASCSLPGILPPVFDGEELLCDGCVLNNLPTDIMRQQCPGPIIAVDIDQSYDVSTDMPYCEGLSGWRLLRGRLNPLSARRRIPNIARVIHRATMVTSAQNSLRAQTEADLYLHPPVDYCGVFDWREGDRLIAEAYEYTSGKLAEWQASGRAPTDG